MRLKAREGKQVVEQCGQPGSMPLDGCQKTGAVGGGHLILPVCKRFGSACDDTQRCAQFMRNICHEFLAHGFKFLLASDVVQDEQSPNLTRPICRRDRRARDLYPAYALPGGILAGKDFDFLPCLCLAAAHSADVFEKGGAVEHAFETPPLCRICLGKNCREGFVRKEDCVVSANDEHRFAKAAQRGFQLGQLPGAKTLEARVFENEFIQGFPQGAKAREAPCQRRLLARACGFCELLRFAAEALEGDERTGGREREGEEDEGIGHGCKGGGGAGASSAKR